MTANVIDRVVGYFFSLPKPWMPDATDEEIMRIIYNHRGNHNPASGQIGMELKEMGMLSDWEEGVMKYHSAELHRRLDQLEYHNYIMSFRDRFRLSDLGIGHVRRMEREKELV